MSDNIEELRRLASAVKRYQSYLSSASPLVVILPVWHFDTAEREAARELAFQVMAKQSKPVGLPDETIKWFQLDGVTFARSTSL